MNQYVMGNNKEVETTRINKEKQQQQKTTETTNKKVTAKETNNKMKKVESKKKEDKNKNKKKNEETKKTETKYKNYWVKYAEKSKMKKIELENSVTKVANENSSQCGACKEGCDIARVKPDRRCIHIQTGKWLSDERVAAMLVPDTGQESESSQVKTDTRPGLKSSDLNERF